MDNKQTQKLKRIGWLDVSRGIAFLMVIYSHLHYCDSSIMRFFSPMFLTTFFLVSGYLFKEKQSFLFVLENRTRTLLLPFIILGMIMIILSQILSFNEHVPFTDSVKGLLLQNGHNQILWFIAALYIYSIIFYWVEFCFSSINKLLIAGIILFVLNAILKYWFMLPSIPWHIDVAGFACFYMALGKFYKHYENKIDKIVSNKILILLLIIYVLSIWLFNLKFSFYGSRYIIDSLIITIIGLTLCVYISKRFLQNNKFLLFVGSNTLFYFAFHGKVYSLLQTITSKVLPTYIIGQNHLSDFGIAICIVLLDAIILIIPMMIVNKYFPQILGKGFKLWKAK